MTSLAVKRASTQVTWRESLALLIFMITVDGFTIYHFLLQEGVIPPFLGGYLVIVSAALLLPSLVLYGARAAKREISLNRGDIAAWIFLGIIFLVAGLHFLRNEAVDVSRGHLSAVVQMLVYFILFRTLNLYSSSTRYVALGSFILMTLVMWRLQLGTMAYDPSSYYAEEGLRDDLAGYQAFALIYLILVLTCIALTGQIHIRMAIYVIAVPTLFINGARAEFFIFFSAIALAEAFFSRERAIILGFVAILTPFLLRPLLDLLMASFPDNRVVWLLANLDADQSFTERLDLTGQALAVIQDSPIFGDFAYYLEGHYAHNALSMWADFGIFGFALLIICLVFPVAMSLHLFIRGERGAESILLALISFGAALLLATSKMYLHPTVLIALALYAGRVTALSSFEGGRRPAKLEQQGRVSL